MTSTPPIISILFDADTEEHVLMARSYGQTMPAGPRLFRCRPEHAPDVEFRHADEASAKIHAARLQAYCNEPHKAGKIRGKEEGEREVVAVAGTRQRGWWED